MPDVMVPKRSLVAVLCLVFSGPAVGLYAAEGSKLQPEPRGVVAPDREVDLEHLRLDLLLDPKEGRIEGSATHRMRPLRDGLRQLHFDQVGLVITEVSLADEKLEFHLSAEQVVVVLPEGLSRQSSFDLRFTYSTQPDTGLHFRVPGKGSPDEYLELWSQGEAEDSQYWFPTFDFPRERFSYEGRFTAPKDLHVVSNGKLLSREQSSAKPDHSTWHYRLQGGDLVSYLVMVAAAPYREWSDSWREIPLHYYAAGDADEASVRRLLSRTAEMMEFLSQITGTDYPYEVYRQVLVQRFIYTGMENSAATVLDRELLGPAEAVELNSWGESVVAHELAHQWFGDLLTCRTWRHLWLNEGFATFFTTLWMEKSKGPEYAARRLRQRYESVARADGRGARPLVRRFFNHAGSDHSANPYSKGASLLQMLRVMLGDDAFYRGIARYVNEHRGTLVETSDLQRAMEEESGMYLDWFFDQWAHLAGNPKLSASHSYDAEKGTVRVQLRQTHKASGLIPRFQLPVEVEIATEDSRIERIWLDGDEAAVQVSVSSAPRYVAVDPRGGLLARIENKQSAAQWAAQLTSKHPYAQELALRGLRKLEGAARDGVRDDVYALLASPDAPLAHRLGAVEILAHWRGPEDVTTLLSTLSSQRGPGGSALLRAELAGGLGSVLPSEAVIKTLERVLNTDPVDQVRARALTALGRLEEERARPRAIAALRSARSDNMSIQRSAARVLGRWGQVDDLAALSGARAAGTHSGLQVAALWASVKIAERERRGRDRDRARAKLLPDAEKMLWDRHLRSRQTAVSVLGQVGDNGSVAALTALLGREDYRELRESVSSAIESIRSRRDTEPDTTEGEVNAKLKGIEKRLKELEQDLQKVQERR
jgi:aminopeptidase N